MFCPAASPPPLGDFSFLGHGIRSVRLVGGACLLPVSSSAIFSLAAAVPFVAGFCHRVSIRTVASYVAMFAHMFLNARVPRKVCEICVDRTRRRAANG